MAFMTLETFFFFEKKIQILPKFAFFFFLSTFYLVIFTEKSNMTSSVLEESALEQILRPKAWLYGFESVFWQILIDILLVAYSLFFL